MKQPLLKLLFTAVLVILLTSCEQKPYERVKEYVNILNQTEDTIYLQYDKRYFLSPIYDPVYHSADFDTIAPGKVGERPIIYDNYQFIMRDSTFHRIISSIKMFKVEDRDSIYIQPEYYLYRTKWKATLINDFESTYIINYLELTNNMF